MGRGIGPEMSGHYFFQVMLVGTGGFIGSALRFMIGGWVQRLAVTSMFPYGTLAVNVLGCFLIGILGGLAEHRQALEPVHRLFFMLGVLGGFTTFSTFAFDSLSLAHEAEMLKAIANIFLQVVLGFAAAYAGFIGVKYLSI
jgi:CrcB protein